MQSPPALSTVSSVRGEYPPVSTLLSNEQVGLRPSWSTVPLVVMLRREKSDFGISIAVYDEVNCSSFGIYS